jgi:hypothetical protein
MEISVDSTGVKIIDILTIDIRTKAGEAIDFKNKTDAYSTHPKVVELLERIKRDICIS